MLITQIINLFVKLAQRTSTCTTWTSSLPAAIKTPDTSTGRDRRCLSRVSVFSTANAYGSHTITESGSTTATQTIAPRCCTPRTAPVHYSKRCVSEPSKDTTLCLLHYAKPPLSSSWRPAPSWTRTMTAEGGSKSPKTKPYAAFYTTAPR